MKKIRLRGILILLLLTLIGFYYYPAPKRDFFELYPHDDVYSQSYKEFQSRKTAEVLVDGIRSRYEGRLC